MRTALATVMSQSTGPMAEPWVSVEDVAAHLGVRKDSVYRWIENRGLPARKIGKLWKLKLSEVDAWVRAEGSRVDDEPHVATSEAPPLAGPQRCIMVVDDDDSVRDTLRDFLSDEGYGALLAADGVAALELLRSSAQPRPSLIILDLGMPNMDGWQFREEQERDPALSAIPIIVVTAERRADISGTAVLRKPLDLNHLAEVIRGLLASSDLTTSGGQ